MKSKRLLLMLLLALCMPWAAMGQATQTLTVHDGTATNDYVPVYSYYADAYLKCEMVYPASELSAMNGAEISSMKFYASKTSVGWGNASFQVFMTEVTNTSISSFSGLGTVVYEGTLSIAGNEMLVTFNTPYPYNGGNLLVGVYNTAKGTSVINNKWQGETVNGASFQGHHYGSLANISGTQHNFLPKTTFTYVVSPSCATPENLTVSDVASNSANLTWTGGSGTYNVDYKKASDENWTSLLSNTSLTTTSLTGLDAITEYQVRVQSVCDGDEVSLYRSTSFTTLCATITTFPWNEDFEDYDEGVFTDPCWVNEHITGISPYIFQINTNTNGTNNTHQLQLPYMAAGTLTKLVLPEMTLPNSNYQFAIDVYRNTDNANYAEEGIRVYASTNGEIEGATELAFIRRNYTVGDNNLIPAETASGWYTYKLPIGISGTCYIILRGESDYGSSTYMDNFRVKEVVNVTANQIVETVSDPATEMTWDQFVSHWNNDDHFTSTTITLMDDISVSTMVGIGDIPFTGTFDGNGHTITVDLTATEQYTAPFRFINDATILNLKVTGTINDDGNKFCAGFAADCYGNNTFTNCVSDVTINGTIEGDGTHGGFIAVNHGSISSDPLATTIFNGCAFTGKLLGTATNQCGGFCGWSEYYDPNYAQTTFNNCVFAPQEVTMGTTGCATFARRRNANYMTINNCYFMQDFNDGTNNTGQGKQAYSITGKSPVVVAMSGEPTNAYSLSGIDIYSTGFVYDGTIYAGDGETVSLALSGGPEFETDHGTLTATDETYTLLMEAYDTEISVVCVTPYDMAVNNVTANSAQVTWQGYSDSYSVNVGKKNISTLNSYGFEENAISPDLVTGQGCINWTLVDDENKVHAGNCCVKSGNGGQGGTTSDLNLSVTFTEPGILTFWARISSEEGWDKGFFSINGTPVIDGISGDGSWIQYTYEFTADPEHPRAFRWYYTKANDEYHLYDDCFYVDDIWIRTPGYLDGTWYPATESPFTIENLDADTVYRVRVRGICDGQAGEMVGPVIFRTLSTDEKVFVGGQGMGEYTAEQVGDLWTNPNNWVPSGAPTIEQDAIIRHDAVIDKSPDQPDATGFVGTAYKITFEGTTTPTLTINDGSSLKVENDVSCATVKKSITGYGTSTANDHYYLLASPVNEDTYNPVNGGLITTASDYDLYSWQYNSDNLEWRNYEATPFSMNWGQGYLYANADEVELSFTGPIRANNENVEFSNNNISNGDELPSFNGWDLRGNPFTCDMYLSNAEGSSMTFYKMNGNGDGFELASGAIKPMEGFFAVTTESGQKLVLSRNEPSKCMSALNINLNQGRARVDNAIVRFDEGSTMPKLQFRVGSTKVYIPQDGTDYAVVRAENVGELPVSFKAEKNGSYTMSFTSEEVNFSYLHLIDNMTGNDVDLLQQPYYTFEASTTDYASRFRLVFATGSSTDDNDFSFINEMGNLVIFGIESEATVQVVDMLGHVLSSDQFSGSYETKLNVAPGIYMIRLINGNDVKVQKVFVK